MILSLSPPRPDFSQIYHSILERITLSPNVESRFREIDLLQNHVNLKCFMLFSDHTRPTSYFLQIAIFPEISCRRQMFKPFRKSRYSKLYQNIAKCVTPFSITYRNVSLYSSSVCSQIYTVLAIPKNIILFQNVFHHPTFLSPHHS